MRRVLAGVLNVLASICVLPLLCYDDDTIEIRERDRDMWLHELHDVVRKWEEDNEDGCFGSQASEILTDSRGEEGFS